MKRKRTGPPIIQTRTLERRTVLEWLGRATVLAIGGKLVAACSATGNGPGASADSGPGGRVFDYDAACEADDFPWAPGSEEHAIFEEWGVRTVDTQDLTEILQTWKLTVNGMVENPTVFSFADVLELERQDQITDFHCVEGWSVHDVPWNGVHLSTVFDIVQPLSSATHLTFTCVGDKYLESLPIEVALEPRSLLGYGVDCNTLPLGHGFPLRMVVPRKWAYKSPKYVYRIELTDHPIQGFWESYGYPYDADVPADRLRPGKY
jgi:DMSO/TMAO reductase YedYZ molybdopterin-dependent catalytic subunit